MKILINALPGIGDAIMFSPSLSLLKRRLPDSQIDMLVMFQQVEQIYRSNKNLNKVYFIDFLNQSKFKSLKEVLELRKNKYDFSVNIYPMNRKEYNLINFLTGAKKRIGCSYNNYSFSNLDFLNTNLKQEEKNRHNVLENFDLIKNISEDANETELGNYELNLGKEELDYAEKYIKENNLSGKLLIGFHAGSATFKGHINKRWASEKFIELAQRLNAKFQSAIILFGTENELNERIHKETNKISFIPKVNNILESVALIKKCKILVSNDTALMHLAAAVEVPTVAIFGYTNYKELYPWKNKYIIVRKELECSPCFFNSPKPVKCIWTGED
ncbi:MAG: glycosyltransferase family 9 protein, partial [Ignavibacteria bacterium]